MELKGATYLYTLATLMITFAGFSALLFVIRQAAGARLSLLDRFIVRNVMTYTFVLTGAALLPALLGLFDVGEGSIWRISAVVFALPMLALQTTYPKRRRRIVGEAPPFPIFAVFVVLGSATTALMLIHISISLRYAAAVYITAVTIDFFTVIYGFVNALDIIMQQRGETN
ncbi:MAG TPA: hypothetical protein VLV87_09945 [Gammaproteobacteria bacterium]|nr:hypothetical protein [Gammaproteobacteria bacterium]